MMIYLLDENMIQQNKYSVVITTSFWIYYQENQVVLNGSYHCYFFLNDKNLSSHMSQNYEHINLSNQKIQSYDQMSKIIV